MNKPKFQLLSRVDRLRKFHFDYLRFSQFWKIYCDLTCYEYDYEIGYKYEREQVDICIDFTINEEKKLLPTVSHTLCLWETSSSSPLEVTIMFN